MCIPAIGMKIFSPAHQGLTVVHSDVLQVLHTVRQGGSKASQLTLFSRLLVQALHKNKYRKIFEVITYKS